MRRPKANVVPKGTTAELNCAGLEAAGEGDTFQIAVSARYLQEIVAVLDTQELRLALPDTRRLVLHLGA